MHCALWQLGAKSTFPAPIRDVWKTCSLRERKDWDAYRVLTPIHWSKTSPAGARYWTDLLWPLACACSSSGSVLVFSEVKKAELGGSIILRLDYFSTNASQLRFVTFVFRWLNACCSKSSTNIVKSTEARFPRHQNYCHDQNPDWSARTLPSLSVFIVHIMLYIRISNLSRTCETETDVHSNHLTKCAK